MSLSAFVKELRAAGISSEKIIDLMVARDDERLANKRSRTARWRNTKPAHVVTSRASRDVTSVTKAKSLNGHDNRDVTSVTLARVVDNLLPIEGTGKKEVSKKDIGPQVAKTTPRSELEAVLDAEHAIEVVAHRQRLNKSLTPHAAKLLAKAFGECPDPNAAADEMIANGWQGFKASWLQERVNGHSRAPPAERQNGNGTSQKRSFTTVAHDAIDRIEAKLNAQGNCSGEGTLGLRGDAYPGKSQSNFELLTAPDFGFAGRKR